MNSISGAVIFIVACGCVYFSDWTKWMGLLLARLLDEVLTKIYTSINFLWITQSITIVTMEAILPTKKNRKKRSGSRDYCLPQVYNYTAPAACMARDFV